MKNKTDAFGNKKIRVPFFIPDLSKDDKNYNLLLEHISTLTSGRHYFNPVQI